MGGVYDEHDAGVDGEVAVVLDEQITAQKGRGSGLHNACPI